MARNQTISRDIAAAPAPADAPRNSIRPVNRETLPQAIVKAITDLIIRRVWKPGDAIPSEKDLAQQFQVGRSTIREAVKSLVVLGVLEARAGEGSFVCSPDSRALNGAFEWGLLLSEQNFDNFIDMRTLLEVESARRAAAERSDLDVEQLFAIIKRMRAAKSDNALFRELGNEFHISIARSSGNVLFESMITTMQQIVNVWYPRTWPSTKTSTLSEHTAIAEAIQKQDSAAAGEAMRVHIISASTRLRSLIASGT